MMNRAIQSDAPPKETIGGNASKLLGDLHEMCLRIERCSDRLYGGRPKSVGDAKDSPVEQDAPIELILERCRYAAKSCHEELTRLENGL